MLVIMIIETAVVKPGRYRIEISEHEMKEME